MFYLSPVGISVGGFYVMTHKKDEKKFSWLEFLAYFFSMYVCTYQCLFKFKSTTGNLNDAVERFMCTTFCETQFFVINILNV